MAGYPCCCGEPLITNCDEFEEWWDSLSDVSITGLVFTTAICPECPGLDGGYVLSKAGSVSRCGSSFYPSMSYSLESPLAVCATEIRGFRLAPVCYEVEGVTYVELILFACHAFGSRSIANVVKALPASTLSLSSGTMDQLITSFSHACDINASTHPPYTLS